MIALVSAGGALLLVPKLGMELIPTMSQGEFSVDITLPAGTPLSTTDATLSNLSTIASADANVARTYAMSGTGSLISAAPSQGGDHWGRLNIVMAPNASSSSSEGKNASSNMDKVKAALRDALNRYPNVQATFTEPELFTFASPIQVEVSGYDLRQLQTLSLIHI